MSYFIERGEYKQPYIGSQAPLGEVAEFINGAAFKPTDWEDEGRRIIRIQNLNDSTKPFNRTTKDVPEKLKVHPGDLLVSWSASLGVFTWQHDEIAVLNQHIFRVIPDESKVTKDYLRHMLTGALADMQEYLHGATMKHVNRGEFLSTQIPLPPLDEQRRIAMILDRADGLRTKRRRALAYLDSLKRAVFNSMFGPSVPRIGWQSGELGSFAKFYGGNSLPAGVQFSGQAGGFTLLKVSDMNRMGNAVRLFSSSLWSEFSGSKASTCPENTVVIPKRGAAIATNKKRITTRPSVLDPNLMGIAPGPALHIEYLYAWFDAFDLSVITSGSSVPQLNKQDLSPLGIEVPPMVLQEVFAKSVTVIGRLKDYNRAQLAQLDSLFSSLQHRAFEGNL